MRAETIYQALTAAGCTIEHHRSDLYVRATPEAHAILRRFPQACKLAGSFISDGKLWIDIPFAYDPFWTREG